MISERAFTPQEPTFSSRDLAKFAIAVSAEPISPQSSFQEKVIFDSVNYMSVGTAAALEEKPIVTDMSSLGEPAIIPKAFELPYRSGDLPYIAREPIPEKIEWLGPKRDETGDVIGRIEGSVVGRTGQEVTVIYPGDVKEDMIKVTSYVRWDTEHPNEDLLHIEGATSTLILGDTGPEVKIERIESYLEAGTRQYSGWYNNVGEPEKIYTQPRDGVSNDTQEKKAQMAEIVPLFPIMVKRIDMYPFPSSMRREDPNEHSAVITVADTYRAHGENIGYLEQRDQSYGGRSVNGTVVGRKGEVYYDSEKKERMVHMSVYVLQEPGNMALEQLAQQQDLLLQTNCSNKREYVITSEILMSDATRYGYVFSAFEFRKEQELAYAA